jgi:uncharacterized protein (DUF2141 family)
MTHLKPLAVIAFALGLAGAASAAPLTVTVEGIEARGGKLYIGVQTQAQFMKNEGVAGNFIEAPAAGSKTLTFDLPEGRYSVAVWHDLEANGVFDTTPDGVPLDGWSSLNAGKLKAAPTFEEASLDVTGDGAAVTLKMMYPD